jgi:hypothetical protein
VGVGAGEGCAGIGEGVGLDEAAGVAEAAGEAALAGVGDATGPAVVFGLRSHNEKARMTIRTRAEMNARCDCFMFAPASS